MNQIPESYDFIENYLRGQLTPEEKELFERRLASDPAFNEEYQLKKSIDELIIERNLIDLRRQVGADISKKSFNWKTFGKISAIVLLAGVAGYYLPEIIKDKPENALIIPASMPEIKDSSRTPKILDSVPKSNLHINRSPFIKVENTGTGLSETTNQDKAMQTTAEVVRDSNPAFKGEQKIAPDQGAKSGDVSLPCPVISFQLQASSFCKGKATGSIVIEKGHIHGGSPPYKFSIGNNFTSIPAFYELEAGNYLIKVQDKQGCISEKSIEIKEKACINQKDYSFNPDVESWQFPFFEDENGTMAITDQAGNVVYKSAIQNGQPSEWSGKTLNGEFLATGTYLYIAQSEKGDIRQGYIVILK